MLTPSLFIVSYLPLPCTLSSWTIIYFRKVSLINNLFSSNSSSFFPLENIILGGSIISFLHLSSSLSSIFLPFFPFPLHPNLPRTGLYNFSSVSRMDSILLLVLSILTILNYLTHNSFLSHPVFFVFCSGFLETISFGILLKTPNVTPKFSSGSKSLAKYWSIETECRLLLAQLSICLGTGQTPLSQTVKAGSCAYLLSL